MPSLVTSVIGGIQGASAAHNAANAIASGYKQAGQTVTDAAAQVNPDILKTALEAGQGVTGAAATGAAGATQAAATGGAAATTAADKLATMLNPYITGGSAAMDQLSAGLGPGGSLTTPFTASMMGQYSPAYQFQLQQGTQAAQRAAAAAGTLGSGGTAKALQRYTQDYAGTAFQRANDIYQGQQQNIYNRLAGVAGMGQGAATTAGAAGIGAAEYAGTLGENAAQYAGNMNTNAAQWAGGQNINARNLTAQNTLSAANYLANTQIGGQQALGQGMLGAASSWNNMLSGIGSAANSALAGGFGSMASGGSFMSGALNPFGLGGAGGGGGGGGFTPYASGSPWGMNLGPTPGVPNINTNISGWAPGGNVVVPG